MALSARLLTRVSRPHLSQLLEYCERLMFPTAETKIKLLRTHPAVLSQCQRFRELVQARKPLMLPFQYAKSLMWTEIVGRLRANPSGFKLSTFTELCLDYKLVALSDCQKRMISTNAFSLSYELKIGDKENYRRQFMLSLSLTTYRVFPDVGNPQSLRL